MKIHRHKKTKTRCRNVNLWNWFIWRMTRIELYCGQIILWKECWKREEQGEKRVKMRLHSQKLVRSRIMEYLREVQKLIPPCSPFMRSPDAPAWLDAAEPALIPWQNFPRILTFARRWNRGGGKHKYFRNWNPGSQLGVFSIIWISMLKASCRSTTFCHRMFREIN